MNRLKPSFYIAMTLTLSVIAIFLSIYNSVNERNDFVIALTPEFRSLMSQTNTLSEQLERPVKVVVLENENELIKSVYSGEVDAYVTNSFFYIEQYAKLNGARAVFGIPSDYFLVSLMNSDSTHQRVGVFDTFIPKLLIGNETYTNVFIPDSHKRITALNEDFVSHIILHESSLDVTKHKIVEKMSNRGYTQDLFILTSEWIEYDQAHNHVLLELLQNALSKPLVKPIESEILSAMTFLFRLEFIPTRYYYKDLVYSSN